MLGGVVSHFYHFIFTNSNGNGNGNAWCVIANLTWKCWEEWFHIFTNGNCNGNDKFNLKVFGGVVSQGRTAPPPDTAVVLNLEPAIRKKLSLILFTYIVKTYFSFSFYSFFITFFLPHCKIYHGQWSLHVCICNLFLIC